MLQNVSDVVHPLFSQLYANDNTETWPSWSVPTLWLSLCFRSNKEVEVLETVSSAISA